MVDSMVVTKVEQKAVMMVVTMAATLAVSMDQHLVG